ncbi:M24 family metallopeptidase [Actinokineospora inagensis]|uniref:M24 family metallopeptidase n=1 Tax=Actinokineospora inagensis TaxID=103730 RepID=UPI00040724B9|nr:Xaa-Pro peptidase family protein [Actinokineospora inagensis]
MSDPHERRRAALRTALRDRGLDALLIGDLRNLRYLTGFTGSNGALLVHADGDDRTVFCTDGRYKEQAAKQVRGLEHLIERASALALAARAATAGLRAIGFESQHVTVDGLDTLTAAAAGVDLVRAAHLVETLRLVKDDTEVEALRQACAIADSALAELIADGGLRPGRTERDVALDLDRRMLAHGAVAPAFDTIVATGPNSAIPHHQPTDAVLRTGDFVKLDFGAQLHGYHSDMTRTLALGDPADWQQEIYDLVAAAQSAGTTALTPGTEVRAVDAAARQVIEDAGRGEQFVHGLGHGVGLQIHEAPSLAKTGEGRLSAGMAVTVEPGVYVSGLGGVRIEDTLVVRDAQPELLTQTTKQLMVV